MPLYDYKCTGCGKIKEVYLPLSRFDEPQKCACGKRMRRMLSAPAVMSDISPYKSMVTGEMITSRSQHRAHLKEHGMIEIGNEKIKPHKKKKDEGLKQTLIDVVNSKM